MKRLGTSAVLIPVVAYLCLWGPFPLFAAAVVVVAMLCYREFARIAAAAGMPALGPIGYGSGLLLLGLPQADLLVITLLAVLGLAMALREPDTARCLPAAGAFLLGVVYVFGCWRTAIALRAFSPFWLLFALTINWVGDSAAYYVGRAFGRHRLFPRVSPGKTWEGTAGSLMGSMCYAALFLYYLLPDFPLAPGLGVAAAGNIAGQVGDLAESAMKRGAGLKDSGSMLPGHGGWLDRVDSSLFSMPVVYALVAHPWQATAPRYW